MKFLIAELDNKRICYIETTEFLIQIRKKNSHKGYILKHKIIGDIVRAVFMYNSINISNEYRKRLFVTNFNKPVLIRSE